MHLRRYSQRLRYGGRRTVPEVDGCVITSYSIHYTKLYESNDVCILRTDGTMQIYKKGAFVITSYSIHYTKLYDSYADDKVDIREVDFFLGKHFVISIDRIGPDGKPLLDGIQETVTREMAEDRVITSYSIHYTKLYEFMDRTSSSS